MTTVGYVGLGQMGAAMASRLLDAGVRLTVFDLDPAKVEPLAARGARAASSAAELAAQSDVVSICVPAAQHVDAVLRGPGGLVEAAVAGQTVLVHSTIAPHSVRAAHDVAAQWGSPLHDACVAGGIVAAASGDVVILAGGLADIAPAAREVLDVYGTLVVDAGPVGSGAALKLGMNVMSYAQFTAAAAAFAMVRAEGADTAGLVDTWKHTGQLGRLTESFVRVLEIPPEHVNDDLQRLLAASADLAVKDLELMVEALPEHGHQRDVARALIAAMPDTFGLRPAPAITQGGTAP